MQGTAGCLSLALVVVHLLASEVASAQSTSGLRDRAAELFEQGVRRFSRAEYEAAAISFLAADELIPNAQALTNAMIAARKGGYPLLAARSAERALGRADFEGEPGRLAREVLAEAEGQVARLTVNCAPKPCSIELDEERIRPGAEFVLPGTHQLVAANTEGQRAAEEIHAAPGESYRVMLRLVSPLPEPEDAQPVPRSADRPEPRPLPEAPPGREKPPRETRRRPLSPAVFVAGALGTGIFAALTTSSGLSALSARRAYGSPSYDDDRVKRLALRTDLLLTGTLLLGGATAAAGLWLVDWGEGSGATVSIGPYGDVFVASGARF